MNKDTYSNKPEHPHYYTNRTFGTLEIQREIIKKRMREKSILMANYRPLGWWECDIFEMTNHYGFVEYEIKLGYTDFSTDKRKGKGEKHQLIEQGEGPQQFWYATPSGLIPLNEMPEYAGLVEFEMTAGYLHYLIRKPAPILHIKSMPGQSIEAAYKKSNRRLNRFFLKYPNHSNSTSPNGFE